MEKVWEEKKKIELSKELKERIEKIAYDFVKYDEVWFEPGEVVRLGELQDEYPDIDES